MAYFTWLQHDDDDDDDEMHLAADLNTGTRCESLRRSALPVK